MDDAQLAEIAANEAAYEHALADLADKLSEAKAEVTRLRAEVNDRCKDIDENDRVIENFEREVARLRGIVSAVEALPEKWYARISEFDESRPGLKEAVFHLRRALTGGAYRE